MLNYEDHEDDAGLHMHNETYLSQNVERNTRAVTGILLPQQPVRPDLTLALRREKKN